MKPFAPINRAQRRQAKRIDARWQAAMRQAQRFSSTGGLQAIAHPSSYTPERAASLSNDVRMSWYRLTQGDGSPTDFDDLGAVLNVCCVCAEGLGQPAIDVAVRAQRAALGIKTRLERLGRLGVDAQSLQDIPPALDLYDELLRHLSPLQFNRALTETARRQRAGIVLREEPARDPINPANP